MCVRVCFRHAFQSTVNDSRLNSGLNVWIVLSVGLCVFVYICYSTYCRRRSGFSWSLDWSHHSTAFHEASKLYTCSPHQLSFDDSVKFGGSFVGTSAVWKPRGMCHVLCTKVLDSIEEVYVKGTCILIIFIANQSPKFGVSDV